MNSTIDRVINSANAFYSEAKKDKNHRYHSWEHCYKCFHDARNNPEADIDYLSLMLAYYLASWGMYRGSSFLLKKDYKVHVPVVTEVLKPKYDVLLDLKCKDLRNKNTQEALETLGFKISTYYVNIRADVKDDDIKKDSSSTLVTKILMGTLGCVPAYDRFFVDGVKDQKVSTGNYNMKSLLRLAEFYELNEAVLEKARKRFKAYDYQYPQMKILDMGFWQIGYEKSK